MKAVLLGIELINDYVDKNNQQRNGGMRLFLASNNFYRGYNKINGICPASDKYWVGKTTDLYKSLLNAELPLFVDVSFTYDGKLESLIPINAE